MYIVKYMAEVTGQISYMGQFHPSEQDSEVYAM